MELAIKIVMTILIVGGLVGLFIASYLLNKRIPRPEGCDEEITAQCKKCVISSCYLHPDHNKDKGD
jgi:hypothetical protein